MPGSANTFDKISGNSVRRSALLIITAFTVLASRSVQSMPSKSSSSPVEFSKVELQPTTHSKAESSRFEGDYSRAKRENFARNGQRGSHDGKDVVLYPGDVHQRRSQISFVPEKDPRCAGKTFCVESQTYPSEYVNNHLDVLNQFKQFNKSDEFEIVTRHDDTDDTKPLCVSAEQIVHPKSAETRDNEWLYVINDENLKQGVRVETCQGDQESRCHVFGELAAGYKTMCKQKYIYRQLVGISTNGTIAPDMFRLPASCCCHLKFEPGTSSRIGVNNSNNKPKSND